jgi:fucose permease
MGSESPFVHAVTWVALLSVFGFGIVMALIGAVKLKLSQKLKLSDAQVGKLISALLFTSLVMVAVSGPFLDTFGHRLTILVGFLITSLGIIVIGNANSYGAAVLGCIILGVGGSGLNTGGNTLIVPAINPDNPAAANNLGNVFFGLGAFVMPLLVGLVLKKLPLSRGLTLIALVLILAVVPVLLAAYPPINTGFEIGQFFSLFADGVVWVAGLALLFYIGLEVSMGSWITTYLKDITFSDEKASGVLSFFWIALMVGRLLASQVVQRGSEATLIVSAAVVAGAAIFVMTRATSHAVATVAIIVVGLCFAPMFPTVVGLTFGKYPPAQHGSVFGTIFAIGLVGGTTIPAWIGSWSQGKSIKQSLNIAVGASILLAVFGIVLGMV